MRNIFLTISGLSIISLSAIGQITPKDTKDRLVVIEKITFDEITDRKIERLKNAQANGTISTNWNIEDFRVADKSFNKEYQRLINGLKNERVKYVELTNKEFTDRLAFSNGKNEYFVTYDHTISDEGKFLVISRYFKMHTPDRQVFLEGTAKGILKRFDQ